MRQLGIASGDLYPCADPPPTHTHTMRRLDAAEPGLARAARWVRHRTRRGMRTQTFSSWVGWCARRLQQLCGRRRDAPDTAWWLPVCWPRKPSSTPSTLRTVVQHAPRVLARCGSAMRPVRCGRGLAGHSPGVRPHLASPCRTGPRLVGTLAPQSDVTPPTPF